MYTKEAKPSASWNKTELNSASWDKTELNSASWDKTELNSASWDIVSLLNFLLTEDCEYLLMETGDKILIDGYQPADWSKDAKPSI